MNSLGDLARVTTATTGTGTLTLGAPVAGYLTFAQAGIADGTVVSYGIADGANSETGAGTYSGGTLTRSVYRSTGAGNTAPINLSGAAQVFVTALSADFLALAPLIDPVLQGNPRSVTPPAADNDTSIATTAWVTAKGYLAGNQPITLSGAVSGSGATAITTTLATVPIASGGTGSTTAPAALTALGAVPAAGGTMTGDLTISTGDLLIGSKNWPSIKLYANAATSAMMLGYKGVTLRWTLDLGNSAAESGSGNGGSDFAINRCADDGSFIATALSLVRASGDFAIGSSVATKPGGGSWTAPSDRSLKSAAAPWHTGLAEVLQLQPITYRYNNGAWNMAGMDYVGLDAADAAAVIPEMGRTVSVPADPGPGPHAPPPGGGPPGGVPPGHQTVEVAGVEAGPLLFALVNAIKEIAARLDRLERPHQAEAA